MDLEESGGVFHHLLLRFGQDSARLGGNALLVEDAAERVESSTRVSMQSADAVSAHLDRDLQRATRWLELPHRMSH